MLVGVLDDGELAAFAATTYPSVLSGETSRVKAQHLDCFGFVRIGIESCDMIVIDPGWEVEGAVALGAD